MDFKARPPLPAGVRTLPGSYYTDPECFRRELETIHHEMWLCAGRREQLAEAGSYFVRRIGNASVIILKDEDGGLRAFHNVCRHRGTLLCREAEGKLPGRIQCAYHAWTYGLDGKLFSAPHMDQVAGFREEDFPLKPVAVAAWDGNIFISLGDRLLPLEAHLGGLPAKFSPWHMGELRLAERRVYHLRANWKLVIHNYSECLHCPIAHPQLQRKSHYLSGDNEPPRPTYLGGRMTLKEGVSTLSTEGKSPRSCLPGLPEEEHRHVYFYAVLPNLLLNLHPDYVMTLTLWPLEVDRTDIVCEWHFHPDEMARPGFDPGDAVEFWDLTNRQDWELSELAQEGIATVGYEPGPYSNREELLLALDRFVLERVERPTPVSRPLG